MGLAARHLVGRMPGSRPGAALEHLTVLIPQQIGHCALPATIIHPCGWISVKPAGATLLRFVANV